MYTKTMIERARLIFDYLYARDNITAPADLIVGFGHFDMKIPRHCGKLLTLGYSKKILLTGGRGAGTADLDQPEGMEFKKELGKAYPEIRREDIIVESESTNTGENILFSERILKARDPGYCFAKGIRSILAVASPYRQKRVFLCMEKLFPEVRVVNSPPPTTFEEEAKLFESKNEDFIGLLTGELERIKTYPVKGFIAPAEIPPEIDRAYLELCKLTH